jgi:Beta/Gamma crystallin
MRSTNRARSMAGLTFASVLLGCLITAPGGAGEREVVDEDRRQMIEQRPLVMAARMIKDAVDFRPARGYAGLVLEDRQVALWWKGPMPTRIQQVVDEANKVAPVQIFEAKHSRAELLAAAAQIRSRFGRDVIHGIGDPGDGSRLILAVPPHAADARSRDSLMKAMPAVDVDTEVVAEEVPRWLSRNDDSPPWKGGAVIVNRTIGAGCTSGFGVLAAGRAAVLTAGHCATANGQTISDGVGELIGFATQKTGHDQMIVPTSSVTNLIYVGPRVSNTVKRVTAWEPCFIGELLCQSGTTTAEAIGSELCRLRVDRFATDSESLVEAVQLDGQQGARPGDSGGPLYSDQGSTVIAKGTMTWVAGSRVGFQDVPTANQDFGGIQIPGSAAANVQLYQHCNFGGWQANFNSPGNVSLGQVLAAGGLNDDASSIRIAPGYRVTLFQHDGQTGTSVTLTGDNSCFVGIGFNDILSSMRIETAGVVFFQDINFGGAQSQPLAVGDYTLAQLQALGMPNDWASSVRVPSGRTLTMYQHDNFTGTAWTLTSDNANFVALSPNANDQVSSVRVR